MKTDPISDPIWLVRARYLFATLASGASTREVLLEGRRLGWSADFTRHVLAAAEGCVVRHVGERWWRLGEPTTASVGPSEAGRNQAREAASDG